jgi:hypothetical protein
MYGDELASLNHEEWIKKPKDCRKDLSVLLLRSIVGAV